MSKCEFNQEDFCLLQDEYPEEGECKANKEGHCTAKSEDLVEVCECGELVEDCDCGINWVLLHDKHDKVFAVTPKKYKELKEAKT